MTTTSTLLGTLCNTFTLLPGVSGGSQYPREALRLEFRWSDHEFAGQIRFPFNRKIILVPSEELRALMARFHHVTVTLDADDGPHALRLARSRPDRFRLALDADVEALREASARAARKARARRRHQPGFRAHAGGGAARPLAGVAVGCPHGTRRRCRRPISGKMG